MMNSLLGHPPDTAQKDENYITHIYTQRKRKREKEVHIDKKMRQMAEFLHSL